MINWGNFQSKLQKRGKKAELSRKTGISTGNIRDWFNPDKPAQPSADALIKISKALDCSVDYLLGLTDIEEISYDPIEPTILYRFPVYGQHAAAGVGQLGRDSNYSIGEYIVDNIPNEAVYAMEIAGESMNHEDTDNLIHTGSIVLINPRFIESELDNKIVIANFKGQVVCKRYIDKG